MKRDRDVLYPSSLARRCSWFALAVFALLLFARSVGAAPGSGWDNYADTWDAVDALGRELPGYAECGPPRSDRTVGIFYFIWHGQHGTDGPYDISKMLAANPDDPAYGPVQRFHHWGEPELGYYLTDDEWVIRKHAQWLTDAGVDVIVCDGTNNIPYTDAYMKLLKVYEQIRHEGGRTPQIAFLVGPNYPQNAKNYWNDLYKPGLYSDLWFRWKGKPLLMGGPLDDPSFPDREEFNRFFSFRQSWAWANADGWFGDGHDKWPWIAATPQGYGWHEDPKTPEEMPVAVAGHPTLNAGRSYHNGQEPPPDQRRTAEGLCFDEQWREALKKDPEFIFITGWNEWVALRFLSNGSQRFLGKQLAAGETYFVDEYNQEFSRDVEPMKGGHTDDYYYQMMANIRRFKGVRPLPPPSPPTSIHIDGDFADWANVGPEYRDTVYDTTYRHHRGWGKAGTYVNTTGRNDIVTAKVAREAESLYFYVQTREPMTAEIDPVWMLLFLSTDGDMTNGWEGYDYLVSNRNSPKGKRTLFRTDGGWHWQPVGTVAYRVTGNQMEMAIARRALDLNTNDTFTLNFHWADNIQAENDIIQFAINGDSAPDRRASYRYSTEPRPEHR